VAGLQFLVATGYVDPAHVGVTGGSYGGFMTMMAISKTPSLWAAAVDEFGIVNWESMFNRAAPPLREYIVSLIGDPMHNKAVYTKTSPLTFLHQETAPLLVLQGENDIRVPKEESEQIVAFLRERGRTVDVHYYPQEGHGFSKREDQIDALTRTVDWFDRFLKPIAGPSAAR
jgi:dipeptidyl aminopeptidase/acylaminoacyl peptidase